MLKIKVSMAMRFFVISLLQDDLDPLVVIAKLNQCFYRDLTVNEIQRLIFPSKGPFRLNHCPSQEQLTVLSDKITNFSNRMKEMHRDPAFKLATSERIAQLNKDPEFIKKRDEAVSCVRNDPVKQRRISERLKIRHKSPMMIAQNKERMKARNNDPEFIAKRDAGRKAHEQKPEVIRARSQRFQELHKDPKFAKRRDAALQAFQEIAFKDPAFIKMLSDKAKKQLEDPEFKSKMIAGRKRFWAEYRHQKAALSPESENFGWENSEIVGSTDKAHVEKSVETQMLCDLIDSFVLSLPSDERAVLAHEFEMPHLLRAGDLDLLNRLHKDKREQIRNQAFERLRNNRELQEILEN